MAILGTRPEAIKMASTVKELKKHSDRFDVTITVTAQQRHLVDQALDYFGIKPDIDLDIMREQQTPSDVVGRILLHLEPLLNKVRPDLAIVQGDTATCLASSLAAFYQGIRLAHIEAGLRTWDKANPFPEEIHRRIVDTLSDLCFAPTENAKTNLLREYVPHEKIAVVGNTAIDELSPIIEHPREIDLEIIRNYCDFEKKIILVTTHRRENTRGPIVEFFKAFQELAAMHEDVQIVFPVHPNPEVRKIAFEMLGNVDNIRLIEPLTYNLFVCQMQKSYLVITDSGGVQEEAAFLGKPVLVLREKTERQESVEAGVAKLVGTSSKAIVDETSRLLNDSKAYKEMARPLNPYGEGRACEKIVKALLEMCET